MRETVFISLKKNIQPVIIYGLFERGSKTEVALKPNKIEGGSTTFVSGFI